MKRKPIAAIITAAAIFAGTLSPVQAADHVEVRQSRTTGEPYTVNYDIGWVEYQDRHIYLGLSGDMASVKAYGWEWVVNMWACATVDMMDLVDGYAEKIAKTCPTVEQYRAFKAAQ